VLHHYSSHSLQGGTIFISLDILKIIENDDQLAIILTHEMAHSLLSHSVKYDDITLDINYFLFYLKNKTDLRFFSIARTTVRSVIVGLPDDGTHVINLGNLPLSCSSSDTVYRGTNGEYHVQIAI
jgi:hypothetical protein